MTKASGNNQPPAAPAAEHKGVDIYKNISSVKLHTSMGVIWPGEEVMLQAKEAKAFAGKLVSRT